MTTTSTDTEIKTTPDAPWLLATEILTQQKFVKLQYIVFVSFFFWGGGGWSLEPRSFFFFVCVCVCKATKYVETSRRHNHTPNVENIYNKAKFCRAKLLYSFIGMGLAHGKFSHLTYSLTLSLSLSLSLSLPLLSLLLPWFCFPAGL